MTPIETTITTADGEQLQAEMLLPEDPVAAAVIAHPHPLMGGDMYTPVPATLFRAASDNDVAAMRFNFRGVGRSTGSHDKGRAERLDVLAALDALAEAAPTVPLLLSGWSFGADVSLAVDDERVAGWFLVAAVLSVVDPPDMAAPTHPARKTFVIGSDDEFAPPARIEPVVSSWPSVSTVVIDGADHFFGPHLRRIADEFGAFVQGV